MIAVIHRRHHALSSHRRVHRGKAAGRATVAGNDAANRLSRWRGTSPTATAAVQRITSRPAAERPMGFGHPVWPYQRTRSRRPREQVTIAAPPERRAGIRKHVHGHLSLGGRDWRCREPAAHSPPSSASASGLTRLLGSGGRANPPDEPHSSAITAHPE